MNLIHRDDCIGIISQIVKQKVWGDLFNCVADTHPSKRQFYTQAAHFIGEKEPEFSASTTTSFKIINNQKVKKVQCMCDTLTLVRGFANSQVVRLGLGLLL